MNVCLAYSVYKGDEVEVEEEEEVVVVVVVEEEE